MAHKHLLPGCKPASPVRTFALAAISAILLGFAFNPHALATPTHNIVFIAVDDLRNWLGYTGEYPGSSIHGPGVYTPNIDALAAASTRYRSAYVSMPQCTASRTSVMWGLSPATHGITSVAFNTSAAYQAIVDDSNLKTIPEIMRVGGYHAAAAGKVFHEQLPDRWDEVGPAIDYSQIYTPFSPGPDNTFMYASVLPANETHPDQGIADWGVDFLDNYSQSPAGMAGKPFFLALGFYQPHMPWRVHQAYYDLYPVNQVVAPQPVAGDLDDVPALGVEIANKPYFFNGTMTQHELVEAAGKSVDYTRAYLAATSHTDDMVGQVVSALVNNGYAGNTTIIFWSDHGFHLGEKFHWRKTTLWEQAARVPLLISSPGNSDYPVGDVTDEVSLLDLAATVLDIAGLPAHNGFEGAPLHDAQNRSPAEIYLNDGKATVANGIKDIHYDLDINLNVVKSRYDLVNDPNELTNIQPSGC